MGVLRFFTAILELARDNIPRQLRSGYNKMQYPPFWAYRKASNSRCNIRLPEGAGCSAHVWVYACRRRERLGIWAGRMAQEKELQFEIPKMKQCANLHL